MKSSFEKVEEIKSAALDLYRMVNSSNAKWPDYSRQWGPWIEWDGSSKYGPEIEIEACVNLYRRSPNSTHFLVAESHKVLWVHTGGPHDVLAYRVEMSDINRGEQSDVQKD